MLPAASAARPAPLFQNEASLPFGVTFNTLTCASVFSSYETIHPVYGWMSQCDDQLVYTTPLSSSSAGRSLYILASNITDVPLLFAPVPGKLASTSFGPVNCSAPVARLSAWIRWK